MEYTGNFKTVSGDTIQVIITTSGTSGTTELTFSGENPVEISQTSDGIFSPVKSRSCTITIVSKEIYFDIYSGSSHGTKVVVNNLTKAQCLFYGFATPCEYNQPLLYLNEIEIEAVDALSTLQDFVYTYQAYRESIVCISDIIKKLMNTAGYTGSVWITRDGKKSFNFTDSWPGKNEYINDDIFFSDDDDHEPISCYEVLEEICNFYGLSAVPVGSDVYLIDYEVLKGSTDTITFYDIKGGTTVDKSIPVNIGMSDYTGDDQNLEIEEVYNKVSFKADVYEVSDDDLKVDGEEHMNTASFLKTRESDYGDCTGQYYLWKIYTRYYALSRMQDYFGNNKNNQNWQCYFGVNSKMKYAGGPYVLTDSFNTIYEYFSYAQQEHPYWQIGYLFNSMPAQCCIPSQIFAYDAKKDLPYKADWSNMWSWFTQACWIYDYYRNNNVNFGTGVYNATGWANFQDTHLGGNIPYLTYVSTTSISYSPPSGNISYLCFTGNLLFQKYYEHDDINYNVWQKDETNHYYGGCHYPIRDVGGQGDYAAASRGTSDSYYNKGWAIMKAELKIGDKYWNGSYWTSTKSTFYINYHDDEVVSENEVLSWNKWVKPVANKDYTFKVGKDAYCIPIQSTDYLTGKLSFKLYMPKIPWSNQIYSDNGYLRVNLDRCPPIIFMKDLGITLSTVDKTKSWLVSDITKADSEGNEIDDDDIIYSTSISGNYVKEMDDVDLKINTWNERKPIAKSYILSKDMYSPLYYYNTSGLYNSMTGTTKIEEEHLIDLYTNHYKTPKKIYNCKVHGYKDPFSKFTVNALPGTNFMVDEQMYNVKEETNEIKLIEF